MIGPGRAVGLAAAGVAALGLAWLTHVPVAPERAGDALLRLAWRARPERIEQCVTQSPEALAALPPHMRQATICEGINASYRLEVRHDGRVVAEEHVRPGGFRRDRPLYVFREVPLPAGEAAVRITFTRVEEAAPGAGDSEAHEAREALRESVPASLAWEARLAFAPRQVRVISYDPGRRELVEVRPE